MSRTQRIVKNVSSNWAGYAVNAAVILALTPYVLSQLGIERYGIWVIINSFIGYYGMLDFGFRAGVSQFLIRSIAAEDYPQANSVISTAVAALSALGVIILLLTIAGALIIPGVLDLQTETQREATLCLLIVGTASAIQISLSPFAAVFVAAQRFDLSNLIGVSMRLLSAAGIVVALRSGFGLVGVAAAAGITTVVGYTIRWIVAGRLVPMLQVSRCHVSSSQVRRIGVFGLWNFLISITDYVYLHFLPLLIGIVMPVAAVGYYALAAGLWRQLNGLFSPIGQVLYPAAAELLVKKETETLKRLYGDGTRLLLLVVITIVLVAFVWAEDFYRLWVGDKYLAGEPFASIATLLQIMLVGTVTGYAANIASQILIAAGRIREVAILKVTGATITIILSVILMPYFGLHAIPIALVIGISIVELIGVPIVLYRNTGLNFLEFMRSSGARLVIVSLTLAASFVGIKLLWIADSWMKLVAQGTLAGISSLLIIWFFGITVAERQQFIIKPLYQLLGIKTRAVRETR